MDAERFAGAADAYDHHVGRYGAQPAAGLIDVAAIRPGRRGLDARAAVERDDPVVNVLVVVNDQPF